MERNNYMRLLISQSLSNDNYTFIFSIDPTSISSDDAALFSKYGPVPINFGGTATAISVYTTYDTVTSAGIGSATSSFTLPDIYFNLPTSFPVQQVFTAVAPSPFATNTSARLLAYRQYIQAQIYTAVINLRNTTDSFTGQFITNI